MRAIPTARHRENVYLSGDNPGAFVDTPRCFCFPTTGLTICGTSGACVTDGEECASLPNGVQACFSEAFIRGSLNVTQFDEGSDSGGDIAGGGNVNAGDGEGGGDWDADAGDGESGGEKLTVDLCDETEECLGVRECQCVSEDGVETFGGRTGCIYLPNELQFSEGSADCAAEGESCARCSAGGARFSSGGAPTCESDTFIDLRSGVNEIDGDYSDGGDDDGDGDGEGSLDGAAGGDNDSHDECGDGSSGNREVPSSGLTGAHCTADSDCLGPRACSQAKGAVIFACTGSACFCFTQRPCLSDADCPAEVEACAQTQGVLEVCI